MSDVVAAVIEVAITLGLVASLVFYEGFGLAAGGLIVPGYIALQLASPGQLAGTFAVAFATTGLIKIASKHAFVFGQRQLTLCVLVGCLLCIASRNLLNFQVGMAAAELYAVGWVVPGLIANWFLRQGVVRTVCAILITSTIVRCLVIVLFGGAVFPEL